MRSIQPDISRFHIFNSSAIAAKNLRALMHPIHWANDDSLDSADIAEERKRASEREKKRQRSTQKKWSGTRAEKIYYAIKIREENKLQKKTREVKIN
jgi:hypothetical protein